MKIPESVLGFNRNRYTKTLGFRSSVKSGVISDHTNVLRFFTLLAWCDVELDFLALVEGLEAAALNVGKMHEDVITLLTRDESEPLVCIEKLDCSGCHNYSFLYATNQPFRFVRYPQPY